MPNPRTISNKFHEDQNIPSNEVTHMVVQFGQYLDHDIAETPRYSKHKSFILEIIRYEKEKARLAKKIGY